MDLGIIEDVRTHLTDVKDNPSKALDEKLLDRFDALITEILPDEERHGLVNLLSSLVPTLQQDPTPATKLISILIRSKSFTFSDVLSIQPPVDFVAGLNIPSPPINTVTLSLLAKASENASDAGIVAGKPDVVAALIRVWLCTPDTSVASVALDVLVGLLRIDSRVRSVGEDKDIMDLDSDSSSLKGQGQGLMWRRIFKDKDIYGLIFSLCSLTTAGQEGQPSKRDKTVGQARLLDFILCFPSHEEIFTSQILEVEKLYGVAYGGGVLAFASIQMIDYKDDVLMHMNLIEFFTKFISTVNGDILALDTAKSAAISRYSSRPLDFLNSKSLHQRTMSYYFEPEKHDALDLRYLYSRSAQYVSAYVSLYPTHLVQESPSAGKKILDRLSMVFQQVPFSKWAHNESPKHDLHVISSLPKVSLLPAIGRASPIFSIPIKPANPDAFNTLATIFHGPVKDLTADELGILIPPKVLPDQEDVDLSGDDKAAARALYFLYLEENPQFWKQIVATAEIVAIKENALAAIEVISAIIGANWKPLPTEISNEMSHLPFHLMTEKELIRRCRNPSHPLPQTGVECILDASALTTVLPYLMGPAQRFTNLVGGRGDSESAAYKVATAKHEALMLLHQKLKESSMILGPETEEWQTTLDSIAGRIRLGPWGGQSDVGGRVATLDL